MEIKEIIQKLDSLRNELDSLRPIPEDRINRLNQKLRLDWNYHSNSIEGNTLTASETKAFILYGITAKGKPFRDYIEMRGHNEALKKLENIVHHDLKITENLIKEFHKIILVEPFSGESEINPGEYKTNPNYLYSPTGERVDFEPPQEVPKLMNELINWLNNHIDPPKRKKKKYDLHPLLIACGFHVRFIQIHPFGDGNGRMSRLFMNLILMLCGYVPAVVKLEKRKEYYTALNLSTLEDMGPLAEFVGQECINSMEMATKAARGESIEEGDDLDKEISLLQKEVEIITGENIKSNKTLLALWNSCLNIFLEKYLKKFSSFEKLFNKNYIQLSYQVGNHGNASSVEGLNRWFNNLSSPLDRLASINVYYAFEDMKKIHFDSHSKVRINFEPSRYLIIIDEKQLEKKYNQVIEIEEIENLINESAESFLKRIKSEIDKTNT